MKHLITKDSVFSVNYRPKKPLKLYCLDSKNCLQASCNTSELLEPFKLSTLASPISVNKSKRNFKALSECSSPHPEIAEKTLVCGRGVKTKDSKLTNIDIFLDTMLRKRKFHDLGEEELSDYRLNFTKQFHRVKYYWRGTSLYYPFTFMKLKRESTDIVFLEDYSSKKVNPNDCFFN